MNEIQKHQEITRAKANVKMLKMKVSRNKASQIELDRAESILAALQNISVSISPAPPTAKDNRQNGTLPDQIRTEIFEIETQKQALCNELVNLPAEECGLELQNKILELREQYHEKTDELRFVITNGYRPSDPPISNPIEFVKQLPTDKYEAGKKLHNLRTRISKYKDRQKKTKKEVKRLEYEVLIAKTTEEIELLIKYIDSI